MVRNGTKSKQICHDNIWLEIVSDLNPFIAAPPPGHQAPRDRAQRPREMHRHPPNGAVDAGIALQRERARLELREPAARKVIRGEDLLVVMISSAYGKKSSYFVMNHTPIKCPTISHATIDFSVPS